MSFVFVQLSVVYPFQTVQSFCAVETCFTFSYLKRLDCRTPGNRAGATMDSQPLENWLALHGYDRCHNPDERYQQEEAWFESSGSALGTSIHGCVGWQL